MNHYLCVYVSYQCMPSAHTKPHQAIQYVIIYCDYNHNVCSHDLNMHAWCDIPNLVFVVHKLIFAHWLMWFQYDYDCCQRIEFRAGTLSYSELVRESGRNRYAHRILSFEVQFWNMMFCSMKHYFIWCSRMDWYILTDIHSQAQKFGRGV